MLREEDAERIEAMRLRLKLGTKIAVVRQALDLLDARLDRETRVTRWKRVVPLVAAESARVNREMRAAAASLEDYPWDDDA